MRRVTAALTRLGLAVGLAAPLQAQSAPPTAAPWQPRALIIIDPRPYLASPSPHPAAKRHGTPHPRATPAHRPPRAVPTAETFERLDTSPSPAPKPYRARNRKPN